MNPSSAARTTAFRLRHAPMGFAAPVTPTRITEAPLTPEKPATPQLDRHAHPQREPSADHPLWSSLALG